MEADRHTNRQTLRQADKRTTGHIHRRTHIHTDGQMNIQTYTDRQMDICGDGPRHADMNTYKQIYTESDTDTDKRTQRQMDEQKRTERDGQTDSKAGKQTNTHGQRRMLSDYPPFTRGRMGLCHSRHPTRACLDYSSVVI